MEEDKVLNVGQREVAFGDGGEVFHPIGDGYLLGGELSAHRKPPPNYTAGEPGAIIAWRIFRTKMDLLGKSREDLRRLAVDWGQPAYRGDQIYRALYAQRNFQLATVSNLPAAFRQKLAQQATITLPQV